jgi:hypothetical protein
MNKVIFIIGLPLLLIIGCACDNPSPIHLSFGLNSYATIDEIKKLVAMKGGSWEVVDHETIGPGDCTIKRGFLTVSVANLTKDFDGRLRLEFFNNQLAEIWGYPNDWNAYKGEMEKKYKDKFFIGYEKTTEDRLVVRVYKDYKKEIYVAWEDKCLVELQNKWIEKHS